VAYSACNSMMPKYQPSVSASMTEIVLEQKEKKEPLQRVETMTVK